MMDKKTKIPITFFQRLKEVSTLRISCAKDLGWRATATVNVQHSDEDKIIFSEAGLWERSDITFHNTVRWTLSLNQIKLEHLRHGSHNPIHLSDFAPIDENEMKSSSCHHCGADEYYSRLLLQDSQVLLYWKIIGPRKNTELLFHYR